MYMSDKVCNKAASAMQVGQADREKAWTVSKALYKVQLLNVEATVTAGAWSPPKCYHEDVDLPLMCEDRELTALKCQWLVCEKVCPCQLIMSCLGQWHHMHRMLLC